MGAHTHPKPFFWKFLNFSKKKKECFSYLDHFRVTKTRWVLLTGKKSKCSGFVLFFYQISDFGEIVAGRSMCGHQALGHGSQNEGRNFCRYCLWGYLGPDMTKIWFFDNPSKWPEKASLCIKYPRIYPKRAWGEYLHPTGTLWGSGPKSKISRFSRLNPQPKFWDVPYGCTYSPQALFLKISEFFKTNGMFFIPWSLSSDENSLSSVDWKKVKMFRCCSFL